MVQPLNGGPGMKNTASRGTGSDQKSEKTLLRTECITPAHIILKYSIKQTLENTH